MAWLATFQNSTGAGTAAYYANGTLATWDMQGVLVNAGSWSVTDAPGGGCVPVEVFVPNAVEDPCLCRHHICLLMSPDVSSVCMDAARFTACTKLIVSYSGVALGTCLIQVLSLLHSIATTAHATQSKNCPSSVCN